MKLRRLNGEGLLRFGDYLSELRANPFLQPPTSLIQDSSTSEAVGDIDIVIPPLKNRFEAGRWLTELIASAGMADPAGDKGFWAWLSLLLFDVVCPMDGNRRRKPGETARHIPDAANYKRYYRHLLAGPWRIFRAHRESPERALAVLCQLIHTPGDVVEQLASRQELVTNSAFISTATLLYVDPKTGQTRKGAGGKSKGTARRLADICNQLDVTWDLYAMDQLELLGKIPSEFDRFRVQ